jgi:hypothetical protein
LADKHLVLHWSVAGPQLVESRQSASGVVMARADVAPLTKLADYRLAAFRRRARKSDIRTGLLDLLRDLAVTQHCQALLSGDPDRPFNLRDDAGSG